MTISQTSQYALEHPFTKKAIKAALSGNTKDLKFLFDMLQIGIYQETASVCTRAYRSVKKENYPQIEQAIREVPPPERLNIHLPIPQPECIVVTMVSSGKKRKVVFNPCQLQIEFIKKEQPIPIAL